MLFAALLVTGPLLAADSDLWVESRGIQVPVTFTMPDAESDAAVPLVVLVHGHGGTRQENGAFVELASMLAEVGIASIRMDFPGCGDSTEAFTHNNITNMLHDVDASLEFAAARPGVDPRRLGILGYSMGGRLTMLTIADEPAYRAAVLWAPVALNGRAPMLDYFGGLQDYERLRATAIEKDSVLFVTPWGQEQQLAARWFLDMEESRPLDALRSYEGEVLTIHGTADTVVSPENGKAAHQAASVSSDAEIVLIDDAGHGFGFFGGEPDVRAEVLGATVEFFAAQLLRD
ncbi:MAG: alpha/beta fold hydrolase [Woeseiaceae bacterium]|nr:alpha/beta fold hydrolase [Woeseiaceae bacterium]